MKYKLKKENKKGFFETLENDKLGEDIKFFLLRESNPPQEMDTQQQLTVKGTCTFLEAIETTCHSTTSIRSNYKIEISTA